MEPVQHDCLLPGPRRLPDGAPRLFLGRRIIAAGGGCDAPEWRVDADPWLGAATSLVLVASADVESSERLLGHVCSRYPGSLSEEELRGRNVLAFTGGDLARMRAELLAAAPLESAGFAFARPVLTPAGNWRLLVHDWYLVGDDDYHARSEIGIDLPPRAVAAAMKRATESQSAVVLVHSHPASDPTPSSRDRRGESVLVPALRARTPTAPVARLILSPSSLSAAVLTDAGIDEHLEVVEVGSQLRTYGASSLTDGTEERFDRQVRAFGTDGQAVLRRLSVAIIGLGGTGSVAAQQLAHLGVSNFLLLDPEVVEETNLSRVVGARPDDVGKSKVDVAATMIRGINPEACVTAKKADVRDKDILRSVLDVDVFFCCTDSQGSRAALTQFAYQYLLPGFDVGVVIHATEGHVTHVSGRVQMLTPGVACLMCGSILDPELVRRELLTDEARAADRYIVGGAVPQPAVISINSAATSLAVTMLLSAVTGVPLAARSLRLRLEAGIVSPVQTTASSRCPWCSEHGAMARGDSWPMPGRAG